VTLEQHLVLKPLFYADIFLQSTKFPYFGFAIKKVLIAFKSFLLKISWKLNFLCQNQQQNS